MQRREDAAEATTADALALAMPESVKLLVLRPAAADLSAPVRYGSLRRKIAASPPGSGRRRFYLAALAEAEGKRPEDYPEWYRPPAGAAPEAPEEPAEGPSG